MRTVDDFLVSLKSRGVVPASQPLFRTQDFLTHADNVVMTRIVPLVESLREDYWVTTTTTALVDGQEAYDIPYRSLTRGVWDLKLVDGTEKRNLVLIDAADEHVYTTGAPTGFFFRGDKIIVRPVPDAPTESLEIWWTNPPGKMIETSGAGLVTGISADTVTCSSVPSTWVAGTVIDFVQGRTGNTTLSMDVEATNVAGAQVSFATDAVPDSLVIGDYLAPAGYSPVLQMPPVVFSFLETLVVQRIMTIIGDYDAAKALAATAMEEELHVKKAMSPRAVNEPKKIVNHPFIGGSRRRGVFI